MLKSNKKIAFIIIILVLLFLSFSSYVNAEETQEENIQNVEKTQETEQDEGEKSEKLEVETEYIYKEETNTVTGKIISNKPLKDTKISWKLSEDKLTYTNENLTSNGSYYTTVEDIYGNIAQVLIEVILVDDKGPEITMEYTHNEETNTVTGIMHSNEKLKNTKTAWKLSEDSLTYTNENLTSNGSYYTTVEDIHGNQTTVLIEVTLVDDKGPEIIMEYTHNEETNTVTGIMHSNEKLKNTKTAWKLSEDGLTYINENLTSNGAYYTTVEDIYGNQTTVLIEVKLIDDKPPEITMEYTYNSDDTITAIMHSNEILLQDKPTWTLSEDKVTYTKVFEEDIEYSTTVRDRYGNELWVKIKIVTKKFSYKNNVGPNITVKYLYDSNEKVTVQIISDRELKDTKPTWTLSEDAKTYTKVFVDNNIYTTDVIDIDGNKIDVSIIVNFFKDTLKGIDVSEYQKMIDWQKVKNSGIDFAIIRAGYRGWGSGKIVEDMFFDSNIINATKVGMDIGIYFYTQAITVEEAKEEARYTLNLLSKYNVPIKYPIAIDTEKTPPGNGRADGISKELRTQIVKAFCQEIENAGYKSMIYANKNWLLQDLEKNKLSNYDIWLAHYANATDYQYPYTIWQYTSTGAVNGIVGNVDMDIGYKRY